MLSTADLKDEDLDTDGNFTKIFLEALNEKYTIYFTKEEMIVKNKLDSIIKSYNALDTEDRKKLLVNRSNEMQVNPFIRDQMGYNFTITNNGTGSSTSIKNGSIKTILKVLSQFRKSNRNEAVISKSGKVILENVKENKIIDQLDKLLKDKKDTE